MVPLELKIMHLSANSGVYVDWPTKLSMHSTRSKRYRGSFSVCCIGRINAAKYVLQVGGAAPSSMEIDGTKWYLWWMDTGGVAGISMLLL